MMAELRSRFEGLKLRCRGFSPPVNSDGIVAMHGADWSENGYLGGSHSGRSPLPVECHVPLNGLHRALVKIIGIHP